jgi:hypothetical protein
MLRSRLHSALAVFQASSEPCCARIRCLQTALRQKLLNCNTYLVSGTALFRHCGTCPPVHACLPADSRGIVAKQRSGELRSFGLLAGGLGSLPLLNWLLGLSNMVGAALLAADMEKKQGAMFVQLAPAGVQGH